MSALAEFMKGWVRRVVELARDPGEIAGDGFDVQVRRSGAARFYVAVSRPEVPLAEKIERRFLSTVLVTGDRDDEMSSEEIRLMWALAGSDFGVKIPKKDRQEGVRVLAELEGVTKGRGVLRGVSPAHVQSLERTPEAEAEAERALRAVLGVRELSA